MTQEKINIAELLNDCPKGMELDCILFNSPVKYESNKDGGSYPISVRTEEGELFYLSKYGCLYDRYDSKCAIFPKGKTTWDGFVPPCKFKDGDVVYIETTGHNHNEFIIIFKEIKNDHIHKYACFAYQVLSTCKSAVCHLVDVEIMRLATEEEKQKLFDAIKANGYKWNKETKTLEKLVQPKFKVGDRVHNKNYKGYIYIIHDITDKGYMAKGIRTGSPIPITFGSQEDNYELVPNKFDITTLKPFDKIIVRDTDDSMWIAALFSHLRGERFYTVSTWYNQCIPFEENQHLLGTTDDCDEFYKTWE